jgi:hypothetical protein
VNGGSIPMQWSLTLNSQVLVSDVVAMVALRYVGEDTQPPTCGLLSAVGWACVERAALDGENHLRLDVWKNDRLAVCNFVIRGTVAMDTW